MFQEYLDRYQIGEFADDLLSHFYDVEEYEDISLNTGSTQRIILVAANFRKEVTSTVLWLMNFNMRIQCMKTTPYKMGNDEFVSFEQIIPIKDAEEYTIGIAEKAQDEISSQVAKKSNDSIRIRFWTRLLTEIAKTTDIFKKKSSTNRSYLNVTFESSGVSLGFVATAKYCRSEIYIDKGDKEINGLFFARLEELWNERGEDLGFELVWERLEKKRACRVKIDKPGNVFDEETWDDMISIMIDTNNRIEKSFRKLIKKVDSSSIR